jgi:hypothetical protein
MNNKNLILLVIILLVIFYYIYISTKYINIYHILPYKKVTKNNIKNIMIGLPTIDRDINILDSIYENMMISILYAKKYYNIEFTLFPICRTTDIKCVDFWNNKMKTNADINNVYLVKPYNILKRHNFDQMAKTFNIILNNARDIKTDALIIIESDIIVKEDTIKLLVDNIKKSHVALCYFNIPWCDIPVISEYNLFYKLENADNIKKPTLIYGHGTGCIIINKDILKNKKIKFMNKKIYFKDNIDVFGQDVGFFYLLNKYRYKVLLLNQKLEHRYKK